MKILVLNPFAGEMQEVQRCQRVARSGTEIVLKTPAALQKSVVEYSPIASGTFDFTKLTQELIQETGYEANAARCAVAKLEQSY